MSRTLTALVLASTLALTGCGNSEEDQASEAIADYLMEQQSQAEFLDLERADAECVAGDMVDGIGVDQLVDYGLLNEDGTINEDTPATDMSVEDAETTADAMFDCTDVMAAMRGQLESSMGEQPAEVQECFDEALTEDAVRGMLVASLAGNQDEASQELLTPLMECAAPGMGLPEE